MEIKSIRVSRWTLLSGVLFAALAGRAATYNWVGPTSGEALWNDPANWQVNGAAVSTVPNLNDTAWFPCETISAASTLTITDEIHLSGDASKTLQFQPRGNESGNKEFTLLLAGKITGDGNLLIGGNKKGVVRIERTDNTYDGYTQQNGGILRFVSIGNLGEPSSLGCPTTAARGDFFQNGGQDLQLLAAASATTYRSNRKLKRGKSAPAFKIGQNVTLYWDGPVEIPSDAYLSARDAGALHVTTPYAGAVWHTDGGAIHLDAPGNELTVVNWLWGHFYVADFGTQVSDLSVGQKNSSWGVALHVTSPEDTQLQIQNKFEVSSTTVLQNDVAGTCVHISAPQMTLRDVDAGSCVFKGVGDFDLACDVAAGINIKKEGTGTLSYAGTIRTLRTVEVKETGVVFLNGAYAPEGQADANTKILVTQTATLAGTGRAAGTVELSSGTTLTAGSSATETGTFDLTGGALKLNAGSRLRFKIQSTDAMDRIAAGSVTVGGPVTVAVVVPEDVSLPAGRYRLMSFASINARNQFALDGSAPASYSLDASGDGLDLVVASRSEYALYTWRGDGTVNAWSASAPNFLLNGQPTAWTGDGEDVHIDDTGSNDPAISLAGIVQPHVMTVENTEKDYVITGPGKLSGDMTLRKFGTGTLTLQGTHDYTGLTLVGGGDLNLGGTLSGTAIVVSNGSHLVESASGVIAGDDVLIQVMNGVHRFSGANTFRGRIVQNDFKGAAADNPWLVADNASSFGQATEVYVAGGTGGNGGVSLVDSTVITGPRLTLGNTGLYNDRVTLRCEGEAGTPGWNGDIVADPNLNATAAFHIQCFNGTLSIGSAEGGNVLSGKIPSVNCRGTGTIEIHSRIDVTGTLVRDDAGIVCLHAAGNRFTDSNLSQGTVILRDAGVWPSACRIQIGKNADAAAALDLDGHDQTCGGIHTQAAALNTRNRNTIVTPAEKPATLTCDVAANATMTYGGAPSACQCKFEGPISLVKKGAGTQVFGLPFDITGTLSVEAGTLELSAPNTFGNVQEIAVNGGCLRLSVQDALDAKGTQDLRLTGDAVVQLDADQHVRRLFVNGVKKNAGWYGSAESGADHVSPSFTGSGRLFVHVGGGTTIYIR